MSGNLTEKVVGVSIGLFVTAIILPISIVSLANVTWYSTNTAVKTMATVLLPVLAVVSIAMYFMHRE